MKNAKKLQIFFLKKSMKDRMTHFDISGAVKHR